ncbi:MAG: 30S ribosomal protein S7 [Alphaproteobacteria bacterium]|nr:30S ribosomal protein S7 [Alphaproteobacteria bacterium]MCB1551889.1 30S ribosomal protein S7 [Alphaproteobacteria bacterium]MCB9985665.1 30S ribosomal protein S7 [Micavibrio sp.]HRK97707.1 30S ribosomal protein S7 [Alphaproteobacteria bacterium]
MSRRHSAKKREILPDPRFGDTTLSKFINIIMTRGKKSVAERIVYDAIEMLDKKAANDMDLNADLANKSTGLAIMLLALKKIGPTVEVKSRRVGGANYQVPIEVPSVRAVALAMRWLRDFSRKRGENTMAERLAAEAYEAANDRGSAIKKRDDTHKMAEANRAFAHYRF